MSSDVIKEFLVGLGFEVDNSSLGKFTGGLKTSAIAVTAFVGAVAAAATGVFASVTKMAEGFDELSDLSGLVNASVKEIEELNYVASLTDSSTEAVASSLQSLNKNAGDAALGVGKAKKIFEKIGVSVKDGNGNLKTSAQLLGEVGGAIKDMDQGQQIAVLERLGIDKTMIHSLTSDVSGLKDEFHALYGQAGIDADKAAQEASDYMDALTRVKTALGATGKAIAARFFSRITQSMNIFREKFTEYMPKIVDTIAPVIDMILKLTIAIIKLGARVVDILAPAFKFAMTLIKSLIDFVVRLVSGMNGWLLAIGGAIAAWKLLNLAFLASPVGVILGLGLAILALYDDYMVWKEGGESLIDWGKWQPAIDNLISAIAYIKMQFETSFEIIKSLINTVVSLLTGDFSGALRSAGDLFSNIFKGIKGTLGGVSALLPGMNFSNRLDQVTGRNAPNSVSQGAVRGFDQTINQRTQISITSTGDASSTAAAVAGQQSRVNADLGRNMKTVAK